MATKLTKVESTDPAIWPNGEPASVRDLEALKAAQTSGKPIK